MKGQNLTGLKFASLTVISYHGNCRWVCRCDCGKEVIRVSNALRTGQSISCGCIQPASRRKAKLDITGQRFGRFVAISRNTDTTWNCQCDCGETKRVAIGALRSGHSKSCGCLHKDTAAIQAKQMGDNNKTHGVTGSPEYIVWKSVKARCMSPTAKNYDRYGGSGITICPEWTDSFETFLADMGPRPSMAHTIDRINNSLGYFKENCRWATPKEQQRNRTNHKPYEFRGESKLLSEWAEEYGINWRVLWHRINTSSWSIEKALTTPLIPRCERNKPGISKT